MIEQTTKQGQCEGAWGAAEKLIVPEKFMACFDLFITSTGAKYAGDVNVNTGKTRIVSFR